MRPAPLFLLILLIALGVGLGVRVLLQAPQVVEPPMVAPSGLHDAAPAPWPASIAGVPQGHVYTGVVEEPADVNPFTSHGSVARRFVFGFTHDTLLDSDPVTGEQRCALAAAFEPSSDGRACTFTLRPDVRFADGSPMTMGDVMFGWELAQAGHVPMGFVSDAFGRIAAVDVLDARRFTVRFRDDHYAAVQAVGESWIVAQRRFFVDRVAELAARASLPTPAVDSADFGQLLTKIDFECGPGTGPYVLHNRPDGPSTWRRRQDLLLVRNDHCWRRTATPGCWNFAGIRLLFRDPTTAFTTLLRHEIDWYSSASIREIVRANPELLQAYEEVSYDYRTLGVFCVMWNCKHPPFGDPRVRRALAMLFDLDALLGVFGGSGTKAKAYGKPASPAYPHDVEPLPFDPVASRRLLREVGFDPEKGTPLQLRFLMPQGSDAMRRTVDLFADAAKQAGVDLQIRSHEWTSFVDQKKAGEWDAIFVQRSFRSWADPFDFVHSLGIDNEGHWQHPEADRLASAARAERDPERRTALLHQLHTLVYHEQPVTFLIHPLVDILLNVHLQDATPGPLGLVLERAFVAPQFQRH